jgi:hypothetical protein
MCVTVPYVRVWMTGASLLTSRDRPKSDTWQQQQQQQQQQ